jgi:uncharacterized membrane protein
MDQIERVNPDILEVIDDAPSEVKRLLAANLRQRAERSFYAESVGKKMTYAEYFALMLWDAVSEGRIVFADGTTINIDVAQWTSITKFLTTHMEGNAATDPTIGALNVFKVYMGFDEDRV